jgi:hypothetical protein
MSDEPRALIAEVIDLPREDEQGVFLAALARRVPAAFPNFGAEAQRQVAALCVLITLEEARRAGKPVSPLAARPYEARSVAEREALRVTVLRVMQAMVALGWIDLGGP